MSLDCAPCTLCTSVHLSQTSSRARRPEIVPNVPQWHFAPDRHGIAREFLGGAIGLAHPQSLCSLSEVWKINMVLSLRIVC